MSSGGGFGKSSSKQQNRVQIPDFLKPFVNQAVGTAGSALSDLQSLQGTDRVANLTPQQLQALGTAEQRANGAGGFFPTMQNTLLNAAQGQGLNSFVPQNAIDSLGGFGQSGQSLIPSELLAQIASQSNGQIDPTSFATLQSAQSLGLPVGADSLLGMDPRLSSVVPQSAYQTLNQLSIGSNPSNADAVSGALSGDIIPQGATDTASQLASGRMPMNQMTLRDLIQGGAASGAATDTFSDLMGGGSAIPDVSRQALQQSAQGDFLFGGQGFDQAVDAAMRAALPQIRSTFGRSRGGATGGLAQEAVGRAVGDSFAGLFNQERGRQVSSAQALANISQSDAQRQAQQRLSAAGALDDQGFRDAGLRIGAQGQLEGQNLQLGNQQLGASDLLSRLGISTAQTQLGAQNQLEQQRLAGQQQQFGAANVLGDLGLANRDQLLQSAAQAAGIDLQGRSLSQDAASTLASLGLEGQLQGNQQNLQLASLLGGLGSDERNRQLAGSQTLADLGNTERGRQLTAATQLPGAATADTDLLQQIGQLFQQQQQAELQGQQGFSQLLLAAALGGLPFQNLLGSNQSGTTTSAQFGGNTVGFVGF